MTDGRPPGLTWRYDRSELVADGIVHVLGAVAAVFAAGALVGLALYTAELPTVTALTVYAVTLIAVIGCSALYNMWPVSRTKWILRRFDRLAVLGYLAIAWSGVVVAHQVFVSLSTAAIVLLVTGGLIYTAGVVFHLWESLRFQNAIWHGFVLVAAGFQYAAILNGVLLVA